MEERAKQIKDVCVKHNITYIHCEPRKIPHGYADSHGIALNWIYKEVIQKRKNNFALLDHDMFPIKEFNIESYLEDAENGIYSKFLELIQEVQIGIHFIKI